MKLKRVLLSHKRTTYQLYVEQNLSPRMRKLFRENHAIARDMTRAHQIHLESIATIRAILRKHDIAFDMKGRNVLKDLAHYDLVISIGGDGTFLRTAHFLRDHLPILGINSSPEHSVGALCSIPARHFETKLQQIIEDRVKISNWTRLSAHLNGRELPELILNDAFVGNRCPASASRYFISKETIRDRSNTSHPRLAHREEQRSSGLWVSSPAGSTAASEAAGCTPIPRRTSRMFQYVVREPYQMPHRDSYRLVSGRLTSKHKLTITSQMGDGAIFIDGPRVHYPFNFGDELTIALSEHPLKVVV